MAGLQGELVWLALAGAWFLVGIAVGFLGGVGLSRLLDRWQRDAVAQRAFEDWERAAGAALGRPWWKQPESRPQRQETPDA